jgi:hypothetical protein
MSLILRQDDFIGVWQRESISINGGAPFEDSHVYWLKAGEKFADIRWPKSEGGPASAFAGRAIWKSPAMHFLHEIDLTKKFSEDVGQLSFQDHKLIGRLCPISRLHRRRLRFVRMDGTTTNNLIQPLRRSPYPPQCIGKKRATVIKIVPASTILKPIVITRPLKRARHCLIG